VVAAAAGKGGKGGGGGVSPNSSTNRMEMAETARATVVDAFDERPSTAETQKIHGGAEIGEDAEVRHASGTRAKRAASKRGKRAPRRERSSSEWGKELELPNHRRIFSCAGFARLGKSSSCPTTDANNFILRWIRSRASAQRLRKQPPTFAPPPDNLLLLS
jgi:hypothetical protein